MKKIRMPVYAGSLSKTVSGFAFCATSPSICGSVGSSARCGSSASIASCGSSSSKTICGSSSAYSVSSACGSSTTATLTNTATAKKQTPTNAAETHCDILAYNHAAEQGYQAGNWDGNKETVDSIYQKHYANDSTDHFGGNAGYGFVDFNSDGKYDHMFFYEKHNGVVTIYDSNGTSPLSGYNGNNLINSYYKDATVQFAALNK